MAHGIAAHHAVLLLVLTTSPYNRTLATEVFDWEHLRFDPDEAIKYLDKTLAKEGAQDLVHGDAILLHFTKRVLTTTAELQSGVSIRKYLRKRNIAIVIITSERP